MDDDLSLGAGYTEQNNKVHLNCRFLVPDNTQKLLKNDGEKWSRKKYFEILRWSSELLLPSAKKSAQKG